MPIHATLDGTGKLASDQIPSGMGGGSPTWGAVTGTLSAQTDLQNALDNKAGTSHNHSGVYQPIATVLTNTTASFTTAQETKLSGIATGATANSSDATLLSRANHTGSQAQSTVTNLTTDLAAKQATLVSGTNIKTVNGTTILGSGDLVVSGSDPWTWMKLASNSTVSTTAYADVTGMSFTATANTTYLVQVFGAYQTAATTTGIGLTLNIPSGSIIGHNIVSTTATAIGGTEIIADDASTGASTGVRAATTNTPIQAFYVVAVGGSGGTVQLRQRSEIATSNTVLQANLTIMGHRVI